MIFAVAAAAKARTETTEGSILNSVNRSIDVNLCYVCMDVSAIEQVGDCKNSGCEAVGE